MSKRKELWLKEHSYNDGLSTRFDRGINPDIRQCVLEFIRWIRVIYVFPVRLNLYFKNTKTIKNSITKETATATIFLPDDKQASAHSRLALWRL